MSDERNRCECCRPQSAWFKARRHLERAVAPGLLSLFPESLSLICQTVLGSPLRCPLGMSGTAIPSWQLCEFLPCIFINLSSLRIKGNNVNWPTAEKLPELSRYSFLFLWYLILFELVWKHLIPLNCLHQKYAFLLRESWCSCYSFCFCISELPVDKKQQSTDLRGHLLSWARAKRGWETFWQPVTRRALKIGFYHQHRWVKKVSCWNPLYGRYFVNRFCLRHLPVLI